MRNSLRPAVEVSRLSVVPGIYSAYTWNNVGFTLWFGPATVESLKTYEEACRRLVAEHSGRWSTVHIVVPGNSQLPSNEAREALANLSREFADTTAVVAVMIPGTGFWASAIRGLVTAVQMLASRNFELKIFGTHEDLAGWLPDAHRRHGGGEITAAQLLTVLRELQRTASARAA